MAVALIVIAAILLLIVLFAFFTMFVLVHQQRSVVIERLGKFNRILGPGLHLKMPLFERVAGKLSLRIQQLEVPVETKTHDNVIVNVSIAVQYKVPGDNVEKAFYQLDDPQGQIESYVLASVRGEVPKMKLDDLAMLREATGVDSSEALATLTLTQQMDMLREIGSQAGSG